MDTSQHSESAPITQPQSQSPSSLPQDLNTPSVPLSPPPSVGLVVESRDVPQYCTVAEADHSMNRVESPEIIQVPVIPPQAVVPPPVKNESNNLIASNISTTIQAASPSAAQDPSPRASSTIHNPTTNVESTLDGAQESTMVFGHKSTPSVTQRRRNYANTNAVTDYEADLTNKDRTKQKEAVKRYLGERIKSNWTYEWPRPESDIAVEDPPISNAESLSEQKWQQRDEWQSDASTSTENLAIPTTATSPDTPSARDSTFRFESPGGVGDAIKQVQQEKKQRRKRRLAEEIAVNDGLRCFVARRDAWTGARKVSKSKKGSSALPKPVQRHSVSSEDGGSSTAIEAEDDEGWETDVEIPIAPPLIPPENAMRASVLPAAYNVIYDKVVVQSITPACPLNLKDVVRSCVQGWKRDGQWPPKSMPEPPKRKSRKLSVASLFSWKEQEKETKAAAAATTTPTTTQIGSGKDGERRSSAAGFRKSFQRIITLGHAGKEGGRAHTAEVTPVP